MSAPGRMLPFGFQIGFPLFLHPALRRRFHICHLPHGVFSGEGSFSLFCVSHGANIFCDTLCAWDHCAKLRQVQRSVGIQGDRDRHSSFTHGAHGLLLETSYKQWLKNWLIKKRSWCLDSIGQITFLNCLKELVSLKLGLEERVSNHPLLGLVPSHLRRETL